MKAKVVSVAALAAAVIVTGVGVSQFPIDHAKAATAAVAAPASVQTLPDFAAIAEANKGAVVNITSTAAPKAGAGVPEGLEGLPEELRRFLPQLPQMPPQPRQGMGSGFIVESNGTILTNAHVVEGADEVRVRLTDRREFKGKVVGTDKATDIAVVKIEAKGLPVVKLGDPAQIQRFWDLCIGVYSNESVPPLGGADALRSSQELIMPDFPKGILPA